jgi:hypothetical protein
MAETQAVEQEAPKGNQEAAMPAPAQKEGVQVAPERKLKIVGGRDVVKVEPETEVTSQREFTKMSGFALENKVMAVASDVVDYGIGEGRKGNIHLDRAFADKAAGFEHDQLAELASHRNAAIAASARLISVWQDQMMYRERAEAAEAKGEMDLGAIEARGLMLGLAKSIAPSVPARR